MSFVRAITIATTVAIFVVVNTFSSTTATDLWLYDDDDYSKHKTFKKFNFGAVQRCYNLFDCFNDKASAASWINAPKDTSFVFYDGESCSGHQYVSTKTPSGQVKFSKVGIDNQISSFMVWQYGTFATSGIVNYCKESAIFQVANATTNSTELNGTNYD
ncbi:hypothetical protein PHYBOEH_008861 [Phytophthora boehmeriae]|uniref:Uncharacterized protein n=1 Tax=Phytophthora boehmeriae TaxID=109152 RepID=A0A8T1W089_9STRA|nr:hypothetical protein PHYBOEH_008861 [Phytophthora boehmeriae]